MATIHLVEGPVGAGKSTYALELSVEHHAPRLDLDEWMVTLFSPDRPDAGFMGWYAECKRRCIEQIWSVTWEILLTGSDVILELGLVQRQARFDFYSRVDDCGAALIVHLLDTPEEVRRERVHRRNRSRTATFKMAVSDEVFELANRAWEAPDDTELFERDFRLI